MKTRASSKLHAACFLAAMPLMAACGDQITYIGERPQTGAGGSASASSSVVGGGGQEFVHPVPLGIEAAHLVADRSRDLVYATVCAGDANYGNSVVAVDPAGAVVGSAFVGIDPTVLAMSDDASTLWVGLAASKSVRRVDLSSGVPTAGPQYVLPPANGENRFAISILVLPGTTDSIVVSLQRENTFSSFGGTIVLDAGVPRPAELAQDQEAVRLTGGPDGWLFGFDDTSARAIGPPRSLEAHVRSAGAAALRTAERTKAYGA